MDNKTKKDITTEWLKAFPLLNAYAQNKLYIILGPFIVGLELIKLPRSENYRPHFVLYPLYKDNANLCMEYPLMIFQFYDEKKNQIDLPYNDRNEIYKKAQSIVLESLKISLGNHQSLLEFFNLVEEEIISDPIYKTHSGKKASLYELQFYAALYTGNSIRIQDVLNKIFVESKSWNSKIFESWLGDFNKWFKDLQNKAKDNTEFLKQIESNRQDKKISQLKFLELNG